MRLTRKQIQRYSRQMVLKKIGPIGQKKLLNSKVLVVGAGGLGSPILIYLAALGIGNIGIIDHDKVDLSNLHRQILFETNDLKKQKAKLASQKIKRLTQILMFHIIKKNWITVISIKLPKNIQY